jgi:hypothetical protein
VPSDEHEQEPTEAAGWLADDALEAMSRTCEDCTAAPYEPCHPECSSRWE